MTNILWLNEVTKNTSDLIGKKAFNLAEMYNSNLPIPKSFIVTIEAFRNFMKNSAIQSQISNIIKKTNIENGQELNEASEKIQDLILSQTIPVEIKNEIIKAYSNLSVHQDLRDKAPNALNFIKTGRDNPFVAVRACSDKKINQDTYLNVRGTEQVTQAIIQSWASVYNPKTIYYKEKNNIDYSNFFTSIIIQKMINSDKSGLIYTLNPYTNENELLIEASFGLGDAILSKSITPDNYRVDKNELKIKDIIVNKKELMFYRDLNTNKTSKRFLNEERSNSQVLTEEEIRKLANISRSLEEYYNMPQLIEFAIENGTVNILNSEPIIFNEYKVEEEIRDFRENTIQRLIKEANSSEFYPLNLVNLFLAFEMFSIKKFGVNSPKKNRINFCENYNKLLNENYSEFDEEINELNNLLKYSPLEDIGPYKLKELKIEDKKDFLNLFEIMYRVRSNLIYSGNEALNDRNTKLIKISIDLLNKILYKVTESS